MMKSRNLIKKKPKKNKRSSILSNTPPPPTTHGQHPLRTFVHPRRPSFLQERCVDQQIQRVVHSIDPDPIPVFHQCQWTGIWSIENIENRGIIEVTKNSFPTVFQQFFLTVFNSANSENSDEWTGASVLVVVVMSVKHQT
jgi:hypothetical protein